MEKKYHCLYQIVNKINGMIYIGYHSTNNLFDSYMGGGKNIEIAHKEFGKENFIKYIIGLYDTKYEMTKAEMQIVNKEFVLREDTYNIIKGGGGSSIVFGISEETREKLSKANKGVPFTEERKQNISKGKKRNSPLKETKQKIIKSKKGIPLSEEHKKNISIAVSNPSEEIREKMRKGCKNRAKQSEETIAKQIAANTGQKRTKEQKQRMSEAQKKRAEEYKISEETRQKMRDSHKGKKDSEETKKNKAEAQRKRGPRAQFTEESKEKMRKSSKERFINMPVSEETKRKQSEAFKLLIWIHNNELKINKRVHINEKDEWLGIGWELGRIKKEKNKELEKEINELKEKYNISTYEARKLLEE